MTNKKNFISIKRGLSQDAKHRERMGNRIWLFLHILDRVDWETGIVYDWRDKDEADDMGISLYTLRNQRQELDELGYISCQQKNNSQEIIVYNWTNPRNYSGEIVNPKGNKIQLPIENKGNRQGNRQGINESVTPSLNSHITNHNPLAAVFDAYFNCGFGQITAMSQEYVTEAVNEYTAEWVIEATRAASKANAHNWKYVEAVLKRWKKEGYQSDIKSPVEMRSVAVEEYS